MTTNDTVRVIYHVATLGNWQEVVREQLDLLARSDLFEIELSFVGIGLDSVSRAARARGIECRVISQDSSVRQFERGAIAYLESLAGVTETPLAYFHTKGVSQPGDPKRASWRRTMGEAVLAQWRTNVTFLDTFDVVGCNWISGRVGGHTYRPHFSGNFFIARPAYVRTLPAFSSYYKDRWSCEWWIGSNPDCRPKSLLTVGESWWDSNYNWSKWGQ